MQNILMLILILAFTACTGGGNGNGSSTGGLTHNQLAEKFVANLNVDEDFDVTLAKKSTLQKNFIVVYDPLTQSYDAINIESYEPSMDAATYYAQNRGRGFFDLDKLAGHNEVEYREVVVGHDADNNPIYGFEPYEVWVPTRYEDRFSGLLFEKIASSPKNLAKLEALKEGIKINRTADSLVANMGLSVGRAKEVARLKAHWEKASKKGMSAEDQDNFSTELLGFSITQGLSAYKSAMEGNSEELNELIELSAEQNQLTPEHASKLMTKVFGL